MKNIVAVLLIVVTYAASVPLKLDEGTQRQYFPEEEDPLRTRFIFVEDSKGSLQMVDLTQESTESRATIDDCTLYLYTLTNPSNPEVIPAANFAALTSSSNYNPANQNVFISHGWNNNYLSKVNTVLRSALLPKHNVNVFVIDWSGPANKFYTTAKDAVPIIGQAVGDFVNQMITTYGLTPKAFNFFGHSLGAHVVGCAGARVNGLVNYIVGMDPAGPLFTLGNIDNRIDPTDGDFVHIIHTNGGLLGFRSAIGDADYYPNGGSSQPGCGLDIAGTCAHSRAYFYTAESILNSNFISQLCSSNNDFNNGRCNANPSSLMGGWLIDTSASGDYFLATSSSDPFALG